MTDTQWLCIELLGGWMVNACIIAAVLHVFGNKENR